MKAMPLTHKGRLTDASESMGAEFHGEVQDGCPLEDQQGEDPEHLARVWVRTSVSQGGGRAQPFTFMRRATCGRGAGGGCTKLSHWDSIEKCEAVQRECAKLTKTLTGNQPKVPDLALRLTSVYG